MRKIPRVQLTMGVTILACLLSVACSREDGLSCESSERYSSASSVPPLRVPADLSVPDETDVLRVPDARAGEPAERECMEQPPDFFDEDAADNG